MGTFYAGIIIIVVALFLMLLNYLKNRKQVCKDKKMQQIAETQKISQLIERMEELKQSAERGRIWRNVEDEREFLEHRLGGLWGLSEIKKSLDKMNGGREDESWRGTDDEEDEVAWV